MIVHRITIKGQKAGRGPIPRNPAPSLSRIFFPSTFASLNSLWLCGSQQTMENSSSDGTTRPPAMPPEKSVGQETTVRSGHGTTDWFQIGKGVRQGCILSPCLSNLCAEYIIQNAVLDETQTGIKIARRNINNFRYADDTTLMA